MWYWCFNLQVRMKWRVSTNLCHICIQVSHIEPCRDKYDMCFIKAKSWPLIGQKGQQCYRICYQTKYNKNMICKYITVDMKLSQILYVMIPRKAAACQKATCGDTITSYFQIYEKTFPTLFTCVTTVVRRQRHIITKDVAWLHVIYRWC